MDRLVQEHFARCVILTLNVMQPPVLVQLDSVVLDLHAILEKLELFLFLPSQNYLQERTIVSNQIGSD